MSTETLPWNSDGSFAPGFDFRDEGSWKPEPYTRKPSPRYSVDIPGASDSDWASEWMKQGCGCGGGGSCDCSKGEPCCESCLSGGECTASSPARKLDSPPVNRFNHELTCQFEVGGVQWCDSPRYRRGDCTSGWRPKDHRCLPEVRTGPPLRYCPCMDHYNAYMRHLSELERDFDRPGGEMTPWQWNNRVRRIQLEASSYAWCLAINRKVDTKTCPPIPPPPHLREIIPRDEIISRNDCERKHAACLFEAAYWFSMCLFLGNHFCDTVCAARPLGYKSCVTACKTAMLNACLLDGATMRGCCARGLAECRETGNYPGWLWLTACQYHLV